MIPRKVFFTKGYGVHRDKLASFELALRKAGIEKQNLVYVSSILPPSCKILGPDKGTKELSPGQITFCVMAKSQTKEPGRHVSAAIGLARPLKNDSYGYLSEHHSHGENAKKAGDYAEDLAATMLATTLGIDFDPDEAWDERKKVYKASGKIFHSSHIVQSARGDKEGRWTTVVAAAVFII